MLPEESCMQRRAVLAAAGAKAAAQEKEMIKRLTELLPMLTPEFMKLMKMGTAYMMFGDPDKSHHRPECECEWCEKWRTDHGRPTHSQVRLYLHARSLALAPE